MIVLQNVEIGYEKRLFKIDDLSLERGGLYSLIGANGKGKTTFLKTLIGELKPLGGDILIGGKNTRDFSRLERAKSITFVGSKQQDVDFLKVKDYVALGRTPYTNLIGSSSNRDIEQVSSSLEQLNITHLKDCFINQISDGEKQLAAISKAIAQETDIIILDEPTAFLDYANRLLVLKLLKDIAIKLNKVVLFSSHDIDSILELGSEILVLDQSKYKLKLYSSNSLTKKEVIELAF